MDSLFENLSKSIENLKIEITTITTERNDLKIQYAELNNNYTILIEKVKLILLIKGDDIFIVNLRNFLQYGPIIYENDSFHPAGRCEKHDITILNPVNSG